MSGFSPKAARRLPLVFALLGLLACRSNGDEGPGRGKPIDAELFQRILAEGTLRPVDDFDSNLMPSATELERLELEQKIKALQDSNPSGQAPSAPGETVPEGSAYKTHRLHDGCVMEPICFLSYYSSVSALYYLPILILFFLLLLVLYYSECL